MEQIGTALAMFFGSFFALGALATMTSSVWFFIDTVGQGGRLLTHSVRFWQAQRGKWDHLRSARVLRRAFRITVGGWIGAMLVVLIRVLAECF